MLTLRRVVDEADGLFRPVPAQADALAYYANAIAHLVEKLGPEPSALEFPKPVP